METKILNQKDVEDKFNSFNSYTEEDKRKVMDNEGSIMRKMENKGPLKKFLADAKTFFQMLKDIFSGRYKGVPVGTIAAIVGTLVYVLCPADLIPDFLPVVGYLDDAAMLALCLKFTKYDVERYRAWRKNNGSKS